MHTLAADTIIRYVRLRCMLLFDVYHFVTRQFIRLTVETLLSSLFCNRKTNNFCFCETRSNQPEFFVIHPVKHRDANRNKTGEIYFSLHKNKKQNENISISNRSHFILFYTPIKIDLKRGREMQKTCFKYIDFYALFMARRQSVVDFIDKIHSFELK